MLACLAGTRSASSVSFHFIRNMSSPVKRKNDHCGYIENTGNLTWCVCSADYSFRYESTVKSFLSVWFLLCWWFGFQWVSGFTFFCFGSRDWYKKTKIVKQLSLKFWIVYLLSSSCYPQKRKSTRGNPGFLPAPKCCPLRCIPSISSNIQPKKTKNYVETEKSVDVFSNSLCRFLCASGELFQRSILPMVRLLSICSWFMFLFNFEKPSISSKKINNLSEKRRLASREISTSNSLNTYCLFCPSAEIDRNRSFCLILITIDALCSRNSRKLFV